MQSNPEAIKINMTQHSSYLFCDANAMNAMQRCDAAVIALIAFDCVPSCDTTEVCLEISQRNMASLSFFARPYYCILNGGRTWPLCLFRVICLRVSRHLACRSLNLQVGTFAATSAMQQKLYALHARFLTHRTLSSLWCDRGFVVSRLCSSDIVAPSRCALTGLVFCWSHRVASACLISIPSRCMVP